MAQMVKMMVAGTTIPTKEDQNNHTFCRWEGKQNHHKKITFPKVFGIFPTSQLLPAKDDNFHNHNIILIIDTVFILIFSHYHHGYMTTTYKY